jgi:hypothetical protein
MYDVNPLGPMMHLKEIERRAIAQRKQGESRSSAHPGEVESLRRKGFAPNQYVGANPYRQSLQLWRDLLEGHGARGTARNRSAANLRPSQRRKNV